jgi:hypothetical protein
VSRRALPNKKYAKELLAHLPAGYSLEPRGRKNHPHVIKPDGEVLRTIDGRPIQVSGTPGDWRSLKNDVRLAMRAIEI